MPSLHFNNTVNEGINLNLTSSKKKLRLNKSSKIQQESSAPRKQVVKPRQPQVRERPSAFNSTSSRRIKNNDIYFGSEIVEESARRRF